MVTASVIAVPQADTPSANVDLICHMTSHERVAKPDEMTRKQMARRDTESLAMKVMKWPNVYYTIDSK
jgi:hypothetical protein